MKTSLRIIHCLTIVSLACLFPSLTRGQDAPKPNANATQRAADDLKAYYADSKKVPPFEKEIEDLKESDDDTRSAAGNYLAALLAQALDDEKSGRAPWQSSPAWGGRGSENTAAGLRKQIADGLADAGGEDAGLDAAQWLIDKDPIAENQADGFKYVAATKSPRADGIIRALLATPHHNPQVLIGAIKEAADRKLDAAADIKRLSAWYRKSVRDAARAAAAQLGSRMSRNSRRRKHSPPGSTRR